MECRSPLPGNEAGMDGSMLPSEAGGLLGFVEGGPGWGSEALRCSAYSIFLDGGHSVLGVPF